MNGVIYCRVSSKEQAQGTSLESQEQACREYAKSRRINVLRVFVERGESAKFADRTELLSLIDFVRVAKGQVQVLLVWKVDRFARNVGDHFNIKATLLKYGVSVVSVTEPIDANPEGKLMETILAGFAQFDNDIRAVRTVQGMRRKIQEGIFPWRAPLGYQSPKRAGEKKTEPDIPDRPVFDLLRKAWKEFATGAYTKAEIRRLMAGWGVVTRRGSPLSQQAIDNLFKNRYYAGRIIDPWSGEEYEGKHVAMVEWDDFARVQQITAKRGRSVPHQKERPEFPLRGLVRCIQCRRYLTASFSRGRSRRYAYYHCGNRKCAHRGKSGGVQKIHEEFEMFLSSIAPKAELFGSIRVAVLRVAEERRLLRRAQATDREKAFGSLERETKELIRMRAQELITDEEFRKHKALLDDRRFGVAERQRSEEMAPEQLRRDLDEIAKPLQDLKNAWEAFPPGARRRFEHLVLPAGFENGHVRTAELGLLFRVFQPSEMANSNGVPLAGESWNRLVQEISAFAKLFRSADDCDAPSNEPVRRNTKDRTPLDRVEPEAA